MKLSWGSFLAALHCSAAAAKVGHVYLHDLITSAAPQTPPTVEPETARLILAQRLGLSRFHSIKNADDEVIQQINSYGGRQPRLFGGDARESNKAHVLVWLEDVEDPTEIIKDPSAWSSDFTISNPPSVSDNDRLIQDMILQAESLPKYPDPKGWTYTAGIDAEASLSSLKRPNIYNEYLSIFRAGKGDSFSMSELSEHIASLLGRASGEKDAGFAITVVAMPPSTSNSKRSASPYGTYDLPSKIEARREATEALLSSASEPSTSSSSNVSNLEDFPVITQAEDGDSPVLGILQSCYETKSACEKQTHNCSSHGACSMIQKGTEGKDGTKDCWGCKCKATTVKVGDDGTKTTFWGGPACQKKDISMPFWLFVGLGVTIAFLISASIGMLYSMGSEELPSVIGAGVSGPSARK